LNCGGRLDALQEQLGHRDINTTRIYLRLSDEDVKREVAKISSWFADPDVMEKGCALSTV